MSISSHRRCALAIALSIPAIAIAQSSSPGSGTLTISAEQVYIANTTDREIVFFLETENIQRTEYRLAPGMASTLRGEPGDKWLNIEMQSGADVVKPSNSVAEAATSQ